MKLSTRLTIAMVALVLVMVFALGLLTYRKVAEVAQPRALDRINTHVHLRAVELEASVRSARADAIGFSAAVAIIDIMNASLNRRIDSSASVTATDARRRLALRFVAELNAKPDYAQFRVIGAADGGRELVRVDRSGPNGAVRTVPDGQLQRIGGQDYFKKAITVPSGGVYVSPIGLNREHNEITIPHVPTFLAAAPIYFSDGRPFGIVIINVDLAPALTHLRSGLSNGNQIYVVNERGDYLVHPDSNREFGFEFGVPNRIQHDFPDFLELLKKEGMSPLMIENSAGARFGAGWDSVQLAGGPRVVVIEVSPYANVMATSIAVRDSILAGGIVAVLCALIIAMLLARSLTRPLVQMTNAVKGFSRGETISVPTSGGREIGVLANAFTRMVAESREKTIALNLEIEERRRIFDTSPDLILVTDRHGKFTRVSPSAESIVGYRPEDMIGRTGSEFVLPDDLEATRNEMRSARRGRIMRNFQTRYAHKNGRIVVLQWSGVWSEPTQQYFFAGRDMTDQKVAEEKFRLAIEASPSGHVMTDEGGSIILVNAEAERLFGYQRHELIGQPVEILVPVRLRGQHLQHRSGVAAQSDARRMRVGRDVLGLRKDGSEFPVEIGLNPIQTPTGLLVMSVIVDITERKKAQEDLRQEVAERQRVLEILNNTIASMKDPVLVADANGKILNVNPPAEKIFGMLVGVDSDDYERPYERFYPDGITPYPFELTVLYRAVRGESVDDIEYIIRSKESLRDVHVVASGRPIRSQTGELQGAVTIYRDITESKKAEEQLRQAQKMESIGQLTGGIAHDFNNMLTVITGTIDILGDAVADKPQLAAIAKLISEAADRGAELTGHLLAFARKQPLQPRETDVNALMVESEKLLRPTLGEHVAIELALEETAWAALVDPSQLTTAILNLAVNARDAMPNGGSLTLETKNIVLDQNYADSNGDVEPGNYVLIAVSDTGSGIPESIRQKVFEPFFTTKEIGKGTGLGLSMVYGFVKQSGGHIKVYSEEGHGTTFKIYLPRASAAEAYVAATEHEWQFNGGTETILLVEDDPLVRASVTAQLQSLGYKTIMAANGAEALKIVDGGAAFDLLFTDMIMPGHMNGRALAEEMAKRCSTLKVLFTSGYTEDSVIHHGRLDPGVLLLAKPYRKQDLARMLRQALDGGTTTLGRHSEPSKSRAN